MCGGDGGGGDGGDSSGCGGGGDGYDGNGGGGDDDGLCSIMMTTFPVPSGLLGLKNQDVP